MRIGSNTYLRVIELLVNFVLHNSTGDQIDDFKFNILSEERKSLTLLLYKQFSNNVFENHIASIFICNVTVPFLGSEAFGLYTKRRKSHEYK